MASMYMGPVVGIDVGTLFLKMVIFDSRDEKVYLKSYRPHHGDPLSVLMEMIACLEGSGNPIIAAITGSFSKWHLPSHGRSLRRVELINALIRGVRRYIPWVRNILDIGASNITLIELDEKGALKGVSSNGPCASGTGSFLDAQALRLGIDPLKVEWEEIDGQPPVIATRCSVFAKSDIIHRQQEGYSRIQMWVGLCRGVADSITGAILKGRPLKGPTAITGGVSLNPLVMHWMRRNPFFQDGLFHIEDGHLAAAIGAAIDASTNGAVPLSGPFSIEMMETIWSVKSKNDIPLRPSPLKMVKSTYPEKITGDTFIDRDGNEIRIHPIHAFSHDCGFDVIMGIDVGSTTTKLCLIDRDGRIVLDIYRRTGGSPVTATKKLFKAIMAIEKERGISFNVIGCATTGSGRRLVGNIVGADEVINEITAHAQGAIFIDPDIETIIEIGGQDSKYISLKDGEVVDGNMNFVCAAGTGSFIEEQAARLSVPLKDMDRRILGITPPFISDRCSVFMAQDIDRLMMAGFSKEECLAGAIYSVAENYLNRVVGNRHVSSRRVFFQGATARNRALVAAFEQLLGVEIVVSPHCHIMGAFGAALRVREKIGQGSFKTRFRGLGLWRRKIQYDQKRCNLCSNSCQITHARIEGEKESPSWGYRCGREPEEKGRRKWIHIEDFEERARFQWVEKDERESIREGGIGIPLALTNWDYYPLWKRFFSLLGYKTVLSSTSDEGILRRGITISGGDLCMPVKLALGHVMTLIESKEIDYILLPFFISDRGKLERTNSYFCPMVQGFPSLAINALRMNGIDTGKCLMPVVDLRLSSKNFFRTLWKGLGPHINRKERDIIEAWNEGVKAQESFRSACQERGRKWISRVTSNREDGVVIVGRPYTLYDSLINCEIPQRIASLGVPVVSMDLLPEIFSLGEGHENMYWSYGKRILKALKAIKDEGLAGIYFTNFNCGPDSFILSYAEREMEGIPFLILEFDEYSSDVGYMTRIEAFLDRLKRRNARLNGRRKCNDSSVRVQQRISSSERAILPLSKRKIWIPPLSTAASRLFSASFRAFGYSCEALPTETAEDYRIGRSLTRGTECLPMVTTTGAMVKKLRELGENARGHTFFMASATGPCRFGQYAILQKIILERLGYEDVEILSPSSHNAYQGMEEGLRKRLFQAFAVSDILYKCLHKIRPYEISRGDADEVFERCLCYMERRFESDSSLKGAIRDVVREFERIPVRRYRRPIIGIVGEIYIRCNPFCNEDLVRSIEDLGFEAWLVPTLEWMLYSITMQSWNFRARGRSFWPWVKASIRNRILMRWEKLFYREAMPFLEDRMEPSISEILREGEREIPINFQGEAILTIGRASIFSKEGIKGIVNCLPFSCMPGNLTSTIFQCLKERFNIPIINLTYDGKGGTNERLRNFLSTGMIPPV